MNYIITFFSNTFVAFLILISIVVIAHELGHFLIGRWLGIGVEEFSVGFGPKIFSFKIGSTVYRVNWLLLGGYVRFYGADLDKNISAKEREKSILHAKLYKRMLVSFAGPFANFVLSFFIMVFLYSFGVTKEPPVFRVLNNSVAYHDGLRTGDRVLSIDNKNISDWGALIHHVSISPNKPLTIEVERDGVIKKLTVTPKSEETAGFDGLKKTIGRIGISPFFSAPMVAPWQNQFFSKIGLTSEDKILSIHGVEITYLDQFLAQMENLTKSKSDVDLAKQILTNKLPSFSIVIQRNQTTETHSINLQTKEMREWATSVLNSANLNVHKPWSYSVASSELTVFGFEDIGPSSKQYHAKESLTECGLKSKDTLRTIDNSELFTSQIDLYSWIEKETERINQSLTQFKNNSIQTNIMVTDAYGKEKKYSCYLPIRHGRNELNQEKLFIDFPIKFLGNPVLYPPVKVQGKNFFDDIRLGFNSVISQMTFIYTGLKKLFSGYIPLSTLGGPIAIAGFAGEAAKAGFETFLVAMSLMSINIGIFNLLPLPVLDGGTILLQIIELFYRKPIPKKTQALIIRIGFVLLLTLFIFVFYNDIIRLFYH